MNLCTDVHIVLPFSKPLVIVEISNGCQEIIFKLKQTSFLRFKIRFSKKVPLR